LEVQAIIKETVILIYALWESPVFIFISALNLVTKQASFCWKWNKTK